MDDLNPDTFDCSELVQWAASQAGVSITDGSWLQYQHVQRGGGEMTVEQALNTPGALLFRFGSDPNGAGRPSGAHVAISLGDGRTIEARGRSYGVDIFDATSRGWTHAGVIPELGGAMVPPSTISPPIDHEGDTDGDGILDAYELTIGTDPFNADTDMDGFIDSVELLDFGTDPNDAASNPRADAMRNLGIEPVVVATRPQVDYSGFVSSEAIPTRRAQRPSDRDEDETDRQRRDDEDRQNDEDTDENQNDETENSDEEAKEDDEGVDENGEKTTADQGTPEDQGDGSANEGTGEPASSTMANMGSIKSDPTTSELLISPGEDERFSPPPASPPDDPEIDSPPGDGGLGDGDGM